MAGYKGVETASLERDEIFSSEFSEIEKTKLLQSYINKYGVNLQLIIAIEEQSELIKEFCKILRLNLVNGKEKENPISREKILNNIYEELAHVNISLEMTKLSLVIPNSLISKKSNSRLCEMKRYLEQQNLFEE